MAKPRRALSWLALLLMGLWSPMLGAKHAGWIQGYEAGKSEARAQQRLAFIYFDAEWCSWCQRYKRETLVAPEVRTELARHYVFAQVDYDARPDLVKRYGIRGLPYTLMLSPEGKVLNGFVGLLTPADLADLLREFAVRFEPVEAGEKSEIIVHSGRRDRNGYEKIRRVFLRHVSDLYDPATGTLAGRYETGATLKRPSPLTWMYLANDKDWRERAQHAALAEYRRLHDAVDGGFFNFLDPMQPGGAYTESSKLLEGNAWFAAWFARAGETLPELKPAADSGRRFLRDRLWDAQGGGFWQAQVADQKYYSRPAVQRRRHPPPPIDRMKRADTNAQAAWALVWYARATGDRRVLDESAGALDFVLTTLWRDGKLYHHWRDGKFSTPDVPLDWFWVLAAGAELEQIRPQEQRRLQLREISKTAGAWLRLEMQRTEAELPDPELAGLIAWVAHYRSLYPEVPTNARDWALARLHLRVDTPPDDLVIGLMAWERLLDRKT